MSAASVSVPDCKEMDIKLSKNTEALCWFNSTNFSLFHKQRPELENFFKTEPTESPDSTRISLEEYKHIITDLKKLYEHYSGKTSQDNIYQFQLDMIKKDIIKSLFNKKELSKYQLVDNITIKPIKKRYLVNPTDSDRTLVDIEEKDREDIIITKEKISSVNSKSYRRTLGIENIESITYLKYTQEKELNDSRKVDIDYYVPFNTIDKKNYDEKVGKTTFDISKGENQDATEYLRTFYDLIFKTAFVKSGRIHVPGTAEYIQRLSILDIRLGQPPYDISKSTSKSNDISRLTEDTYTFFVETSDTKELDTPFFIQEKITVPLFQKKNPDALHSQATFLLDAIVIHTGGSHYYSMIRCGTTSQWIRYNDTDINQLRSAITKLRNDENTGTINEMIQEIKSGKITFSSPGPFSSFKEIYENDKNISKFSKILIYSRKKE